MEHIGDSIDKSLIRKRRKKFFAMIIGLMIGIMPTVNVWAETITFNDEELVGGNTIKVGESIVHTAITGSGGYKIYYYDVNGACIDNAEIPIDQGELEFEVTNQGLANLKHWSIDYKKDHGDYIFRLTPVFNPDPTPPAPSAPAILPEEDTEEPQAEKVPVDEDKEEDKEDEYVNKHNPDALNARYYLNGLLNSNYILGKTEQSPLGQMAFNLARPQGWRKAFSMSMSYKGRNEYSKKEGTIVLYIPEAYQKKGRKYAIMAIDKSGNVSILEDTDIYPNLVTVTPGLEGYAYELIYSD